MTQCPSCPSHTSAVQTLTNALSFLPSRQPREPRTPLASHTQCPLLSARLWGLLPLIALSAPITEGVTRGSQAGRSIAAPSVHPVARILSTNFTQQAATCSKTRGSRRCGASEGRRLATWSHWTERSSLNGPACDDHPALSCTCSSLVPRVAGEEGPGLRGRPAQLQVGVGRMEGFPQDSRVRPGQGRRRAGRQVREPRVQGPKSSHLQADVPPHHCLGAPQRWAQTLQ